MKARPSTWLSAALQWDELGHLFQVCFLVIYLKINSYFKYSFQLEKNFDIIFISELEV